MFFPMTSGSPLLRRRVPAAFGPRFGLLDALDQPQLVPITENSSSTNSRDSPEEMGIPPLRWHAGQVGLLDALNDTGTSLGTTTRDDQRTLQFIGRYPVWTDGPKRSDDNTVLLDAGKQIVGGLAQAGKDLWTGVRLGNSGMYRNLANIVGLLNGANDVFTRTTGYGILSKDTYAQDVKDWLDATAAYVAPPPEDIPTTIIGKINAGLGQAPAEVAQMLMGTRLLGPIAGLATVNAVRESDKGAEAAAKAAAEGAIFGLAAKALEPLNWVARATGLGGLGAASSLAENGDSRDAIAAALPLGLLGAFGVPRAKQPNLVPLQVAYSDFNEAAKHAKNSLDIIRGLSPERQQQLRVQINHRPGVLLQEVARLSDELLGYKTTRGRTFKLPASPWMLSRRTLDYGRSKWWKRFEDPEVKRENAEDSRAQRYANFYLESEGVRIPRRRENETLRRARIQLGKEGRFDPEAEKLGAAIRKKIQKRGLAE